MERERLTGTKFVPSGATLLDLILGGGWPIGRIVNIVGDRSVGKTLLAIEACANFAAKYDVRNIKYIESEAAFDEDFAERLGLPSGLELTRGVATVEQFHKELEAFLDTKGPGPCMCILDSLDALSDDSEMERGIGEATYGTSKARKLSELFRRITNKVSNAECLLIIISQVRENVGVSFGETKTRSGGKALDFYATICLWLSETGKIKRTVRGIERTIGITVKGRCKKNKIALPHRDAEVTLIYNYGLDDEESMLNFITKSKINIGEQSVADIRKALQTARINSDRSAIRTIKTKLALEVNKAWQEIEAAIAPPMRKYE